MSIPHNEKMDFQPDASGELVIYSRGWGRYRFCVVFLGQEIWSIDGSSPFELREARGIVKGILLAKQLPTLRANLNAKEDAKDKKEFARLSTKFGK